MVGCNLGFGGYYFAGRRSELARARDHTIGARIEIMLADLPRFFGSRKVMVFLCFGTMISIGGVGGLAVGVELNSHGIYDRK
ncbi:MAG: hypothetical protein IPO26_21170 [Saprospiraceae bacterium]|nr:hypothetical protein [Saprospiraceae bacterium]